MSQRLLFPTPHPALRATLSHKGRGLKKSATIVIPQYGGSELTVRCVRSLRRSDVRDWPIVIVSDGCDSADIETLRKELAGDVRLRLLTQPHRGVTAAWNRGAREVETDAIVFLNNDVVCLGDWGVRFLRAMSAGEVGVCGTALRRERLPLASERGKPRLQFFEGWCLGVSRELFRTLGGFDERLALYWSDTDFQLRCAAHLGDWCWLSRGLVPGLPLRHLGHRTSRSEDLRRLCREQWRNDRRTFLEKWGPVWDSRSCSFPWDQHVEAAADL